MHLSVCAAEDLLELELAKRVAVPEDTKAGHNAGSTLLSPMLLGAKTSWSADILIGPADAVLDAVPAQPLGDAGAVLVEHRAAAPPL